MSNPYANVARGGTPGRVTNVTLAERAYLSGKINIGEVYTPGDLAQAIGSSKFSYGGSENLLLSLATRRSPLKLVQLPNNRLRVEAR